MIPGAGGARADGALGTEVPRPSGPGARWRASLLVFALLLVAYVANRREIGAVDTVANTLLPVAILRGDGLALDRFLDGARQNGALPYWAAERGGRIISRYPVAPALVAVPLTAPQLWALDRFQRKWDRRQHRVHRWLRTMAKNSAAVIAASTGLLFHQLLLRLGLRASAMPATLAVGLGSEHWSVASQSAWQHGPAAFFLTLALVILVREPSSRWRLATSGAAAAAAACCRPTAIFFAAALALWTTLSQRQRALWFLLAGSALGGVQIAYNVHLFGSPLGGTAEILETGDRVYQGVLSTRPWNGLLGTLLSPNRGLFVFSPWTLLAVAALPCTARRIARAPFIGATLLALIPFTALVSAYKVWWAGWSFGPRYWTEAMPLFGVLLAYALQWSGERSLGTRAAFATAILLAVAVQAIGAFSYPSSWNREPVDVDRRPERVWDWRDTELRRCLVEGPRAPVDYPIFPRVRRRE